MKPSTAKWLMVVLILACAACAVFYNTVLVHFESWVWDVLFYITLLGLVISFEVIRVKFWRCPKCGRRLSRNKVRIDLKECPYCGTLLD